MKGDHRIINEILLFGISAMVVFSVATLVSFAVSSMKAQTQREQYYLMGDLVSMSLTKAYLCGKLSQCSLISNIPDQLSNDRYTVTLLPKAVEISNFETEESTRVNTLEFQRNLGGFVSSNGRYFVMESNSEYITITR